MKQITGSRISVCAGPKTGADHATSLHYCCRCTSRFGASWRILRFCPRVSRLRLLERLRIQHRLKSSWSALPWTTQTSVDRGVSAPDCQGDIGSTSDSTRVLQTTVPKFPKSKMLSLWSSLSSRDHLSSIYCRRRQRSSWILQRDRPSPTWMSQESGLIRLKKGSHTKNRIDLSLMRTESLVRTCALSILLPRGLDPPQKTRSPSRSKRVSRWKLSRGTSVYGALSRARKDRCWSIPTRRMVANSLGLAHTTPLVWRRLRPWSFFKLIPQFLIRR
ncbi:MAG: hypothetical protein K0Q89_1253 [Thermomicrobiales bacterium]|nr:hypothetical protein [Thermomicrobiales bacterium]